MSGKFTPGTQKPNNSGRKKGVPNKRTQESIERVEWVLSLLEPTLERDIKKLSERDRVRLWEALQEYVRPKLNRTELTGNNESPIETKTVIQVISTDHAKRLEEIERRLYDQSE